MNGTTWITLTVLLAVAGAGLAGSLPPDLDAALRESSLIYVSTKRTSGEWSRPAPIWFWYDSDDLYFSTSPDSWKAKRIRRGSPLRIRVGSEDGPEIVAGAKIIHDLSTVARMGEAYSDKYWIAWLGFFRPRPGRVESGKTVAVRVSLPGGEVDGQ